MATEKGWFIKSKEPNDIYFTLQPEVNGTWTRDIDKALLFARKTDCESYFQNHFHETARPNYDIHGLN